MSNYFESDFISFIILYPRGIDNKNVSKSATGCAISIPVNPKNLGNKNITGIRNKPCFDKASSEALNVFLVVCSIILDNVITPHSGIVSA